MLISKRRAVENSAHFYILTVLACTLMIASYRFPYLHSQFNSGVISITGYLVSVARLPVLLIDKINTNISTHMDIVNKNKAMLLQLKQLNKLEFDIANLKAENKFLQKQLNMVTKFAGIPLTVNVLFDASSPFMHSIIIAAGKNKNIEKGQAVIADGGLVGRILEVYTTSSRVLLINDGISRTPIKVVDTGVQAIAAGINNKNIDLIFISGNEQINSNSKVVTSGLGGVFSSGIPVGRVGANGMIIPFVNFTKLSKVTVLRRHVEGVVR